MTVDDLPVCTHVIARDPPGRAPVEDPAVPPLPGADAGRGRARRVGGGPVSGPVSGAASGPGSGVAGGPPDTITLDSTARYRRRMRMRSDAGTSFLLDLPSARLLRDGDSLVLSDGGTIEVRAAAEALYEVRARGADGLLRLAWHVGNRHLPTEVHADHLRIREDAVIGRMLEGLGARVTRVSAGFDPEGGAYAEAPSHGHAHSHGHSHGHAAPHEDSDGHAHAPSQGDARGTDLGDDAGDA